MAGRVIDDVLDRPLPRAVVWLSGASVRRTAITGSDGAFAFPDLPAGSYLLSVQREAYDSASVSVLVPAGREIVVDVQLTRRPELLPPVVVHAPPDPRATGDADVAAREPDYDGAARALRALDMRSRAGSMLAGTLGGSGPQRPSDPTGGDGHTLFVWGTEDESAQVLLDGAVIGAPLHLGGLLPSVDPELVDHARLRTGGAPARFDGGTGYVLELSTREPSPGSLRMWGESNLLTDRVGGEAALGQSGSILAGARRVRTEMLPRLSGVMRGYWYDDVLARASLRTGENGELRATLFGTNEALRIPRDQGSDEAAWWNRAGSLAWNSGSEGERSAVRLSMARAVTDLPLLSAYGGHLRGDVNRATVAANHRWETETSRWGVGGEVEYARFGREARVSPNGVPSSDSSDIIDVSDRGCDGAAACAHARSTTAAFYGDMRHRLSERLWLDAGL
ncbi:MAG TPA: carboxypeptidase-like regulatory domain-containing protein, partial [Gemmatimonadaceae bacterium]|nr:carboxypeptidase-like regulatory domain-containing protein [Gemmatimonadaceae bacterium]